MKTYTINNINDFLQIPDDKVDMCLTEFTEAVKAYKNVLNQNPEIKNIIFQFKWTDDNKESKLIKLHIIN